MFVYLVVLLVGRCDDCSLSIVVCVCGRFDDVTAAPYNAGRYHADAAMMYDT